MFAQKSIAPLEVIKPENLEFAVPATDWDLALDYRWKGDVEIGVSLGAKRVSFTASADQFTLLGTGPSILPPVLVVGFDPPSGSVLCLRSCRQRVRYPMILNLQLICYDTFGSPIAIVDYNVQRVYDLVSPCYRRDRAEKNQALVPGRQVEGQIGDTFIEKSDSASYLSEEPTKGLYALDFVTFELKTTRAIIGGVEHFPEQDSAPV